MVNLRANGEFQCVMVSSLGKVTTLLHKTNDFLSNTPGSNHCSISDFCENKLTSVYI